MAHDNDADTSEPRYAGPCHQVRRVLTLQMEETASRYENLRVGDIKTNLTYIRIGCESVY